MIASDCPCPCLLLGGGHQRDHRLLLGGHDVHVRKVNALGSKPKEKRAGTDWHCMIKASSNAVALPFLPANLLGRLLCLHRSQSKSGARCAAIGCSSSPL
jgi:hypothetical protein